MQWLIVGLGNPGKKYLFTRHNIGFMVVDALAYESPSGGSHWTSFQNQALIFKWRDSLLVKPQTYMNNSGEVVQSLRSYYQIPTDHILVVQDDIDQPFGQMRFHFQRGHGGHNGIRSLHQHLGPDYVRLKLGICRPVGQQPVADYVLSPFSQDEEDRIPEFIGTAKEALEYFMINGLDKAASKYNVQNS